MKQKIIFGSVALAMALIPSLVMAQPGGGPGFDVPLDGGLSVLVAGGTALGIRHYLKNRKNQADQKL